MTRDLFLAALAATLSAAVVFGLGTAKRGYSQRLPSGVATTMSTKSAAEAHFMGRRDAPHIIVEFSDFQCRYCRDAQASLSAARAKYGSDLAIAYMSMPAVQLRPLAATAAKAAICADELGAFEAYHNYLFANQDSIGVTRWVDVARRVGLRDTTAFGYCLTEPRTAERLAREIRVARQAGVSSTPMFIIAGRLYENPGAKLLRLIEDRLTNSSVP